MNEKHIEDTLAQLLKIVGETNAMVVRHGEQLSMFEQRLDAIDQRLDTVDQRLDGIDQRLDGIDQRLDRIDQRLDGIDQRLDGIDQRLDRIDQRLDGIDQRLDGIDQRLDRIDQRLDGIDQRLDGIDQRFEGLERRLDGFAIDVGRRFDERSLSIRVLGRRQDKMAGRIDALEALVEGSQATALRSSVESGLIPEPPASTPCPSSTHGALTAGHSKNLKSKLH